MRRTPRLFAALAAVAIMGYTSVAPAAVLNFTVDQNLSALNLVIGVGSPGNYAPVTVAQTPGSDTTSLFGSISADVSGGNLTFLGGGDIQFALQGVDQQPLPLGLPGSAPAQYGFDVAFQTLVSGTAALRNAIAEATSGAIAVAGGTFDATQVSLDMTAGSADLNLSGALGVQDRISVAGFSAANEEAVGSLVQAGNLVTLTLPVLVELDLPAAQTGLLLDLTGVFTGSITATAIVPEPGTMGLLSCGLIGLIVVGRRRFRKA